MDHFNKVCVLAQDVTKISYNCEDGYADGVPDQLRLWWKATEVYLSLIVDDLESDSAEIENLLIILREVLDKVPPAVYGTKLPIIRKLIWFCDDYLSSSRTPDKEVVSKFHHELLDFRHQNESAFKSKKRHLYDRVELEVEKLFDTTVAASLEDDQLIEQWLLCEESELSSHFSKHLKNCDEEKDFKKLGVILWKFFHVSYFSKSGLSKALPGWMKAARRVIFQSSEPNLLFQILSFLPVILEQDYSLPFKTRRKEQFSELFKEAKNLIRQIYFSSEFTRKFDSLIRQYWKFFFYFLRREKYPAFETLLDIFVPILEVKFYITSGRSNCSAEMSEVYYALNTSNKLKFRQSIKNALQDSVKTGSSCFTDLFPSKISDEQLDKYSLMDAVIYEAVKDGNIDEDEREILKQLFTILKFSKEETLGRINEIRQEVLSDGKVKGALNPRELMRKLLTIAFVDGDLDIAEKRLLNIAGKILGISKTQMQELFFLVKDQDESDLDELAMISVFCFNPDFDVHWEEFQEENLSFEELSRDLRILTESDELVFDGDQVDWGEFYPVPLNVEISRMPGSEKAGIFFFVDRRGVLLLREILNLLAYVIVKEGKSDSKIRLQMCDGREISIFQNEGFQFDNDLKHALKKHNGRVSLILVDSKDRQIISYFESGCGVIEEERWQVGYEAIQSNDVTRIKLLSKKADRETPGDRYTRNLISRSIIKSENALIRLNEFEKYYQYVSMNDPFDYEFLYLFAYCLYQAGRYSDAEKMLKRSLKANDRYYPSLLLLSERLRDVASNELYIYLMKLLVYFGDSFNLEKFLKVSDQTSYQKHLQNLSETVFVPN